MRDARRCKRPGGRGPRRRRPRVQRERRWSWRAWLVEEGVVQRARAAKYQLRNTRSRVLGTHRCSPLAFILLERWPMPRPANRETQSTTECSSATTPIENARPPRSGPTLNIGHRKPVRGRGTREHQREETHRKSHLHENWRASSRGPRRAPMRTCTCFHPETKELVQASQATT